LNCLDSMKRLNIFLIVVLLLITGVLYYRWRKPVEPAPGAPPNLVAFFPEDASFVLYADAAALRSSPFVQDLLKLAPAPQEDREYQDFVRQTGFDYPRDLDRLALAGSPTGNKTRMLAIAEGRFDRGKISAYALRYGTRVPSSALEAYRITTGQPPRETLLTFLSENRVSLTEPGVEIADHSPAPAATLTPLQERIARVSAAELFAVIRVTKPAKDFLPRGWVSSEIEESLSSIRWITLAARPENDRMILVLEAECDAAGNARKLSWGLDGLRLLLRISLSDPNSRLKMDPAVAALLDIITRDARVSSTDRNVRLNFELTREFLAAAKQKAPPAPAMKAVGQ
jgi:hypothetical protein